MKALGIARYILPQEGSGAGIAPTQDADGRYVKGAWA